MITSSWPPSSTAVMLSSAKSLVFPTGNLVSVMPFAEGSGETSELLLHPWYAQLRLDDPFDVLGDLGQRDAAHDLVEEAGHQHMLGQFGRQATAHEVEPLVLRHRSGGGAVRAAHVVGADLQLRDRDGLGLLVEQKVTVRLVGVGLLRALVDDDDARVDGLAGVAHGALEEDVGARMLGGVVLQRELVVVLPLVREVEAQHFAVSAGALEARFDLGPRGIGTHAHGETLEPAVAAQVCPHPVEVRDIAAPVLERDVAQVGAALEDELRRAVVEEAAGDRIARVLIQVGEARVVLEDNERPAVGQAAPAGGDEGPERQRDLGVARNVHEGAVLPERRVERRVLGLLRVHSRVEVLADEVLVLTHGGAQVREDDTLFRDVGLAVDDLAAAVDHYPFRVGVLDAHEDALGHVTAAGLVYQVEPLQGEALQLGVAPLLAAGSRVGGLLEGPEGGPPLLGEPLRLLVALDELLELIEVDDFVT